MDYPWKRREKRETPKTPMDEGDQGGWAKRESEGEKERHCFTRKAVKSA